MGVKYQAEQIEKKWQQKWAKSRAFHVTEDTTREKYYLLEMYPYPSGRIHMGHVRNYSIGDVIYRYLRVRGYNVLHPMGWDAFGMPAENAAIEQRVHPATWTSQNIDFMRIQLQRLGYSYDWSRELATCTPEYYKWNQWIFLKMYERGLAYRKKSFVNWCPSCLTVLANEQVEAGLCWRCGKEVTQKELEQWFLRITHYAAELLESIQKLRGAWPDRVLTMQTNWVGKSYGAETDFPLLGRRGAIGIYTTRQDTLYGATFMVLAPEHPLALELSQGTPYEEEVRQFIARQSRVEKFIREAEFTEKEGVFTGQYAINPLTEEQIPIWVANFVLMEYGTGAIMAVPAHDQRDLDFARKYGLSVRVVIHPYDGKLDEAQMTEAYLDDGYLVNSGPFNGLNNREALDAIGKHLEENGIGRRTVNYRLRDWGISRQRYWGTPIPIVYCDDCGIVPVPYEDLPVILPLDLEILEDGRSPLPTSDSFIKAHCPRCGVTGRRETDTMDTFVDSSWYFCRFASPQYGNAILDKDAVAYWMPVDQYIGGIEHAILHLLYARFFTMFFRDLGLCAEGEPFRRLLARIPVSNGGGKSRWEIFLQSLREPHQGWTCGENVQVQEKRRGSRCHRSKIRGGHGSPVLPIRFSTSEGLRVERSKRGRLSPLFEPTLELGRRSAHSPRGDHPYRWRSRAIGTGQGITPADPCHNQKSQRRDRRALPLKHGHKRHPHTGEPHSRLYS
jgi:leucyl-tRNA synthetase